MASKIGSFILDGILKEREESAVSIPAVNFNPQSIKKDSSDQKVDVPDSAPEYSTIVKSELDKQDPYAHMGSGPSPQAENDLQSIPSGHSMQGAAFVPEEFASTDSPSFNQNLISESLGGASGFEVKPRVKFSKAASDPFVPRPDTTPPAAAAAKMPSNVAMPESPAHPQQAATDPVGSAELAARPAKKVSSEEFLARQTIIEKESAAPFESATHENVDSQQYNRETRGPVPKSDDAIVRPESTGDGPSFEGQPPSYSSAGRFFEEDLSIEDVIQKQASQMQEGVKEFVADKLSDIKSEIMMEVMDAIRVSESEAESRFFQ